MLTVIQVDVFLFRDLSIIERTDNPQIACRKMGIRRVGGSIVRRVGRILRKYVSFLFTTFAIFYKSIDKS